MSTPLIIDVSSWQGAINWPMLLVSGQVQGAIIRASEGWSMPGAPAEGDIFEDPTFRLNWAGAGPLTWRGMYAYFRPNDERARQYEREQTVAEQVERLTRLWLDFAGAGDFLAWDFEPRPADLAGLTPRMVADRLWWAMTATEAGTGHPPVLYCNRSDWDTYLRTSGHNWNRFLIWFANPLGSHPQKPGLFSRPNLGTGMDPEQVALWQYSWKGVVPGIAGNVDFNTPQAAFERLPRRQPNSDTPEVPGTGDDRLDAVVRLLVEQDRRIAALEQHFADAQLPDQEPVPPSSSAGKRYRVVEPRAALFEENGDRLAQLKGQALSQGDQIEIGLTKVWSTNTGQPRQNFGLILAGPKRGQVGAWVPMKSIKPE